MGHFGDVAHGTYTIYTVHTPVKRVKDADVGMQLPLKLLISL
jgi:hypothetical protein